MNKKLINLLMFTSGAAIGSLVTWKVVKTKYERILQEEIESVKEAFGRKSKEDSKEKTANSEQEIDTEEDLGSFNAPGFSDSEINAYRELTGIYARESDLMTDNTAEEGEGDYLDDEKEVPYINGPYVILPEDFGDGNYDHDVACLTIYSDGILADDWYVKLNVEDTIGEESLDHIGDYTEDVVYVRNERLKMDYEVVQDSRTYDEAFSGSLQSLAYED